MRNRLRSSGRALRVGLLAACAATLMAGVAQARTAPAAAPPAAAVSLDAEATAYLNEAFKAVLALSPQTMTQLGSKTRYGELDAYTVAASDRSLALLEAKAAELKRRFDRDKLGASARVSYDLFLRMAEEARAERRWRDYEFIFAANGSPAGDLAAFMINNHRVESVADAEAYVARLREIERVGGEIADDFQRRAAAGLVPPAFVFTPAIEDARAVITGAPFGEGPDAPLWADFKAKVDKLDADAATKARLKAEGLAALAGPARRGYERMITALETVRPKATSNDGVWRLPDGEAYYAAAVKEETSTDLTPAQIHEIGLAEVARIRGEMEKIKDKVGFKGSLAEFMQHVKTDPAARYPNTEAGKAQYLADAKANIAQVMAAAPTWFGRLPKSTLEVRAVEKWREQTASVAFYNRGTADGSRPGIYYVNLGDMNQVQKGQAESIAYHEGAPGHHFQISLAQEQGDLPLFRQLVGYGAYTEGWGLYSERLGKEMGFFTDPYSDFGRLGNEMWRAVRLVTDTGLHAKRWSREQAIQYFRDNTTVSERDIVKEVERYLTNPGQATSYKIGELKITALREEARRELGPKFDIRRFHDAVLGQGSLPLDVLETQMRAWIAAEKARS